MISAPVPGVVNALQVTIPGRSPSVPSVKALGNARDEKKEKKANLELARGKLTLMIREQRISWLPTSRLSTR